MDAKSIIRAYITRYRPWTETELGWFRSQASLSLAIEKAALAIDDRGKRYSHQRRFPREVLSEAHRLLLSQEQCISEATSFEDLHSLLEALLKPIKGIGDLYIYDTALRIGAKLGHAPDRVYLHAGTRAGAKALRLYGKEVLQMEEIPLVFQQLEPFEVEDILCIFKNKLATAKGL